MMASCFGNRTRSFVISPLKIAASTFCPKKPVARAVVEQWMDWQATDLYLVYREAFYGLVRAPGSVQADRVKASVSAWVGKMLVLNNRLRESEGYVAGVSFTMADIPIGIAVNRWSSNQGVGA